jgi:hypothetical protein
MRILNPDQPRCPVVPHPMRRSVTDTNLTGFLLLPLMSTPVTRLLRERRDDPFGVNLNCLIWNRKETPTLQEARP